MAGKQTASKWLGGRSPAYLDRGRNFNLKLSHLVLKQAPKLLDLILVAHVSFLVVWVLRCGVCEDVKNFFHVKSSGFGVWGLGLRGRGVLLRMQPP